MEKKDNVLDGKTDWMGRAMQRIIVTKMRLVKSVSRKLVLNN